MKKAITILLIFMNLLSFSQEKNKSLQKSNDLVFDANELVSEDFISAEKEYRKALSKVPSNAVGSYNLGNAMYKEGHFDEAMANHLETIKNASSKEEKHKAFHNIGNVLMEKKACKEAVEAYKNALRNNPKDDESRYNLALAKECAKQQGDGEGDDENKDQKDEEEKKEDENKDNEDDKNEGDDKNDEQDNEGDDKEDKKDGDEKEDDKGKPKDEKDNNKEDNKPGDKKKQQQKPQPGQLSPQQVKNLLEAMNNHEKKVQDKINAKKTKGARVRTEKDW